jgi:hypothetical protein
VLLAGSRSVQSLQSASIERFAGCRAYDTRSDVTFNGTRFVLILPTLRLPAILAASAISRQALDLLEVPQCAR